MPSIRALFAANILALASLVNAQSSDSISVPLSPGKESLISSERKLEAQEDVASVPIYYNFDQKIGAAHKGSTQYTEIVPYIPYRINSDYSWVLHPQVTYQTFQNFDGYSSSGFKSTIIQSFLPEQVSPDCRIHSVLGQWYKFAPTCLGCMEARKMELAIA